MSGRHLAFPFRVGADGRTAAPATLEAHIRGEIMQLLLTNPEQENQMGDEAYKEVLQKEPRANDPEGQALIARVGKRLAAVAPDRGFAWEFNLIESPDMNAFCLPGGKVVVYTGILPITRTEAGLAVVIGHEVAHALARHGAERMSDQMVAQVGTTAAAVALSATVTGRSRTYLPAMMAAVGAGATYGYVLPMSRAQESEADRIGLILMAMAGYDPREAVTVWERMRAANTGPRKAEWLSTHPADTTRIADIRHWLPEAMRYYRPQ